FFQAEDGIRDFHVTGVQTCALPISPPPWRHPCFLWVEAHWAAVQWDVQWIHLLLSAAVPDLPPEPACRSSLKEIKTPRQLRLRRKSLSKKTASIPWISYLKVWLTSSYQSSIYFRKKGRKISNILTR